MQYGIILYKKTPLMYKEMSGLKSVFMNVHKVEYIYGTGGGEYLT